MTSTALVLFFISAIGLFNGCSTKPAETSTPAAGQTSTADPDADETSDVTPPAQPSGKSTTGTVVETMDASSYTYVRVKTDSREFWAASNRFKVAVGDRVVMQLEDPMENFHSPSLKRDFPQIYFVPDIRREGDPAPPPAAAGHPPIQAPQSAALTEVVAPAKGGTTVADVWARRAALAGKQVTIRGKVMKFSAGILGRSWIHLQDGTGAASDGSNDLTITTTTEAKVGDVITATGTVAVDKDLGSGYLYKVIVEDASVTAK